MKKNWEDFSVEIQEEFLKEQVRQGNPKDPMVFKINICADRDSEGFAWSTSPQGSDYWNNLVYPKPQKKEPIDDLLNFLNAL